MKLGDFSFERWQLDVKHLYQNNSGYQEYVREEARYRGRLISVCTPVLVRPSALVIGTNHSDFICGGGEESTRIARRLSDGNSAQTNSLAQGSHRYARNLRKLSSLSGHPVSDDWVGTNRCPIQTGSSGILELKRTWWFRALQVAMDELLFQLIGEVRPANLILCGGYAAELVFGSGVRIRDLAQEKVLIGYKSQQGMVQKHIELNAIPIQHPSRVRYSDAHKIRDGWVSPSALNF